MAQQNSQQHSQQNFQTKLIDPSCKRISFGRTALEPKASLGAKPETFGVLVRHRQPILNKLMKRVLTGIEHDDAPERNPFKKTAAPKA